MPDSCICILTGSLPFRSDYPAASELGEKRRKCCRSRLKAELAPRRARPRHSTLPPIIPLPVLMEKLFSVAFPKTLLFYCIIMGLIRVKPCLLSGTSCFSLVL